jgi:hypothetical protein
MVAERMFVLAIFILIATSSIMVIHTPGSNDIELVIRLLFPGILVLVLLSMVIDYFNMALVLRLKLKLWENLRWYFQVYYFTSIFGCFQKITPSNQK